MHVQFSLLMTAISLSRKRATAWRYWKERSLWANSSLTRACGHSCRHSSKGHSGLTVPPSNNITEHCAHKLTCGGGLFYVKATFTVIANAHQSQLFRVLLQRTRTHYLVTHLFIYCVHFPTHLAFSFLTFLSLKQQLLSNHFCSCIEQ